MSLTCPASRPPICPRRVPTFQMAPTTNHIISHQSLRFPYQRLDLFRQPHHISSLMNDAHTHRCTLGQGELRSRLLIAEIQLHLKVKAKVLCRNSGYKSSAAGLGITKYLRIHPKYLKSTLRVTQ